jgi:hypothetical protein
MKYAEQPAQTLNLPKPPMPQPVRMILRNGKTRVFPSPASAIAYLARKGAFDRSLI